MLSRGSSYHACTNSIKLFFSSIMMVKSIKNFYTIIHCNKGYSNVLCNYRRNVCWIHSCSRIWWNYTRNMIWKVSSIVLIWRLGWISGSIQICIVVKMMIVLGMYEYVSANFTDVTACLDNAGTLVVTVFSMNV